MKRPVLLSVLATLVLAGVISAGARMWKRNHVGNGGGQITSSSGSVSSGGMQSGAGRVAGAVRDANGVAISGATVRLQSETVSRTTVTNTSGDFQFADVGTGSYVISAKKTGFPQNLYHGQADPSEPVMVVAVTDRSHKSLDLVLRPASSLSGRVVDETGRPIVGAFVNVLPNGLESQGRSRRLEAAAEQGGVPVTTYGQTRSTLTDDNGRFRIEDLAAGEYYVLASAGPPPTRPTSHRLIPPAGFDYLPIFFPRTPLFAEARTVQLKEGEGTVLDLSLEPSRVVPITGTAMDARGAVLTRAGVRAYYRAPQGGILPFPNAATQSGTAGDFVLHVLPNRSYIVAVQSGSGWLQPGVQSDVEAGIEEVSVGINGLSNVRVAASPAAVVSGEVVIRGDHHVDASRIRVRPVPIQPWTTPPVLAGASVNAEGRFELHNVFGHALLALEVVGEPAWIYRVTADGRDLSDAGLETHAREHLRGVTVSAERTGTEVTGCVRDTRNNMAPSSIVILFSSDRARRDDPLARYTRITRANADGTYAISGLPDGEYYVAAVRRWNLFSDRPDSLLAQPHIAKVRVDSHHEQRFDVIVHD